MTSSGRRLAGKPTCHSEELATPRRERILVNQFAAVYPEIHPLTCHLYKLNLSLDLTYHLCRRHPVGELWHLPRGIILIVVYTKSNINIQLGEFGI